MSGKYVVTCGWEHVPHISEEDKVSLLAGIPLYQRRGALEGFVGARRRRGLSGGRGHVLCDRFELPDWMPVVYVLDVGWTRTAAP
jgi:hypothetical protein